MPSEVLPLPIERVHLFERNPRHGYIAEPDEVIRRLLEDEQVYELAKSIVEQKGTNPLNLIGVVRIDDEEDEGDPTYVVWEGNRRVCAIMLLNDPDLAPDAKWQKRFQALSDQIDHIDEIEGRVFEDEDVLRFWMRNIHNGAQKGRGRKEWGPDEQHRDNPTKKYAIAFELLELAEANNLISSTDRKGKLTTLQRFVGQQDLRKILGADDSNPKKVKFSRKKDEFNKLLSQLISDLLDDTINSRKNEDQIREYALALEGRAGVQPKSEEDDDSTDRGNEEESEEGAGGEGGPEVGEEEDEGSNPSQPYRFKKDKALKKAITDTGNDKLISLYGSLLTVSARKHTQLVAVGAWSLIETIAAVCGAKDGQSFTAFFSTGMMQNSLGVGKSDSKTIWKALDRFADAGNETKHDAISAAFNNMELINDMERVSPMLATALVTLPKK